MNRQFRTFGVSFGLLVGLLGAAPMAAQAAAITIDDTNPNDTITFSACDFEFGMSVNGTPMGNCGVGSGGSVSVLESAGALVFSGSWFTANAAASSGSRTVYFVEEANPLQISDVFSYTWSISGGTGNIGGSFESDVNNNLGMLPVGATDIWVENGRPFEFSLAFLGGSVTSDRELPEPTSLALVGLALAGMGMSRRRKA